MDACSCSITKSSSRKKSLANVTCRNSTSSSMDSFNSYWDQNLVDQQNPTRRLRPKRTGPPSRCSCISPSSSASSATWRSAPPPGVFAVKQNQQIITDWTLHSGLPATLVLVLQSLDC